MSGANTFTTQEIALPVNRVGIGSGTKATIIEFLWCDLDMDTHDFAAAADLYIFSISVGAVPTAIPRLGANTTVCSMGEEFAITTSGAVLHKTPLRYDFQDKLGYGFLIPTDSMHISVASAGMGSALTARWRVYYRFVDVPIGEYVGIVTSLTT